MPRAYLVEFRARAVGLVRAGRIRKLDTELLIVRQAVTFLGEHGPAPEGSSR